MDDHGEHLKASSNYLDGLIAAVHDDVDTAVVSGAHRVEVMRQRQHQQVAGAARLPRIPARRQRRVMLATQRHRTTGHVPTFRHAVTETRAISSHCRGAN